MTGETLRSRLAGGGTAFGTMVFEFHTLGIPGSPPPPEPSSC